MEAETAGISSRSSADSRRRNDSHEFRHHRSPARQPSMPTETDGVSLTSAAMEGNRSSEFRFFLSFNITLALKVKVLHLFLLAAFWKLNTFECELSRVDCNYNLYRST